MWSFLTIYSLDGSALFIDFQSHFYILRVEKQRW